jgi:hypothetical protein
MLPVYCIHAPFNPNTKQDGNHCGITMCFEFKQENKLAEKDRLHRVRSKHRLW